MNWVIGSRISEGRSQETVSTGLAEKDVDVIQGRKDHEPLDGHVRSALEAGVRWKDGLNESRLLKKRCRTMA